MTLEEFKALDHTDTLKVITSIYANMDLLTLKAVMIAVVKPEYWLPEPQVEPQVEPEVEPEDSLIELNDDQETQPDDTPVYIPPPRVKDAEKHWPYMRCKNVAKKLNMN